MSATKNPLNTKFSGKNPLRVVLIVPFVLQTTAVVGLIGYLSFKNGQKAINDIAAQLRSELSMRIDDQVKSNVQIPPTIVQLNANAVGRGEIDIINGKGEQRFSEQLKLFPSTSYVYCGSQKGGEAFGVEIDSTNRGRLYTKITNASTNFRYHNYNMDSDGNRTSLKEIETSVYDARKRPWYKAAVTAGKVTWSEIYLDFSLLIPTITASAPIYNKTDNSLIGVCAVDLYLPRELSNFLKTLKIGKSGQTFIMERSGVLVASSTKEPITTGSGEETKRLKAEESNNPLVKATGEFLRDRFPNLNQIQSDQQLEFFLNGERQFVQVTPFKDDKGLDWLIVLIFPESDFLEQINANNRITIWLCVLGLLVAIAIAVITAQLITRPIMRIAQASEQMADGNFDQQVKSSQIVELARLANSFNQMATQLKTSFSQLNSVIDQANQVSLQVTTSTSQIADAGKQLEASALQQANSTKEANATATAIANTAGQLAKTMEDVAQKATATAIATSSSQQSLTQIASAMTQLAEGSHTIATRLRVMNEKANNITSAVNRITEVADRINLISLNAAIEAEKAGEYGAGFAIVAQEVRRLADNSAAASQEIEQMVKEIQSSVYKGVMEVDKFSHQVQHHIELVSHISQQIAQVIEQVQSLTPQFEMVSHSMEDQFEGARQISVVISQLTEASVQTVASLQDSNQALERLNDTAQILKSIIQASVHNK
ncbi:MAG TPA: methyl-accepting chemotaxis protein [Leptolyngbyaceae cyanobacterium]